MNFFFRLPKFRKKIRPLLFCFFNRQEDCLDEPLGTYQVSRGIHVQGKLCNSANSLSFLLPRLYIFTNYGPDHLCLLRKIAACYFQNS